VWESSSRRSDPLRARQWEALAVDLAPIRVNAIRPGLIDKPLIDSFTGPNKESFLKTSTARIRAKRAGTPEEVADGVLS
jgi:NAD(P)-dependent dehydrogenase (short-subunit alcohol dehydrogenase family)